MHHIYIRHVNVIPTKGTHFNARNPAGIYMYKLTIETLKQGVKYIQS